MTTMTTRERERAVKEHSGQGDERGKTIIIYTPLPSGRFFHSIIDNNSDNFSP